MRASMPSNAALLLLLLLSFIAIATASWSKEDHEIFRLRDEVELNEGEGVTFYDFIGVKTGPSATVDEITKSYRRTSLRIHPDKHKPAPHLSPAAKRRSHKKASERFTRLGLVSNILRGPERDRYDHFLKNGFPKWRGTGYYYARFRPGLGSVLAGLFAVAGVVQYAVMRVDRRQKRQFMLRYIQEARAAAWGKDGGVPGLPTTATEMMDITPIAEPAPATEPQQQQAPMNRKERRANEKKSKKTPASVDTPSTPTSGTSTPPPSRPSRRKIVAPNGKQFLVDSSGAVYLLETDDEGETHEFLLDVADIQNPRWTETLWFTLPRWVWGVTLGRVIGGGKKAEVSEEMDGEEDQSEDDSEGEEERRKAGKERAERRKRVKARGQGRK
ncbi:hypothetical protein EX30DRAFT_322563 [Ascodesmis nigricans]|uniref:J domain-containing protein n=1 Tax=Ascodesmis nigricans TaxID=341454 RepID=A0A4S2MMS3_9PEZI|nr:hypothetical protein EX30DRAFT_322563 [Ascodesmis nigricans]